MIGRSLGRYHIVGKLGEGGMGSVWKAEDTLLERTVALKFLPEALAASPDARGRFLREARAASKLDHPGIAAIYDAGEVDDRAYIAMQFVDGQNLREFARGQFLPVDRAMEIACAAAEALGYAHSRGIVHRDVTSKNIMLARDGRVLVVDFGLAVGAEHTRRTRSGAVLGTVGYLAPEVVQGHGADARSDLYGLGAVLYEMVAGRLPFEADRQEALLYQVVHEPVVPPSRLNPKVPASLDRVILKALAKDPAERYVNLVDFVHALREVETGGGGIPTGSGSGAYQTIAVHTLRRSIHLGVMGLVLVGSGVLAWGLVGKRRNDVALGAGSIAVLPFRNQSPNPEETAYLGPGLAEHLAAKLTRVTGLRLIPWWSSQRYGDASMPLQAIATQLGADALLVGTYSREMDGIGCSIAFVDGRTGLQQWVEEIEAPLGDLLALQERITIATAKRLTGELSAADQTLLAEPQAKNWEALDAYLKGQEAIRGVDSRAEEVNERARTFFDQALNFDPDLAPAHIGLGAALHNRYFFGWGGYESLRASEASYLRALRLDPGSLEARSGLARVYWQKGQWERCRQLAQEVERLGSEDLEAQLVLAEIYSFGGLVDRGLMLFEQVMARDPNAIAAHWFLTIANAESSRWRETIERGEKFLELYGEDGFILGHIGMAYHALGQLDRARELYSAALRLSGDDTYFYNVIGRLHHDMGDEAAARGIWSAGIDLVRSMLERYPDNYRYRSLMAENMALLGDRLGFEHERDRILREDPQGGLALVILARGAAILGDVDDAMRLLRLAVEGHGGTSMFLCYLDWGDYLSPQDLGKFKVVIESERERARRLL